MTGAMGDVGEATHFALSLHFSLSLSFFCPSPRTGKEHWPAVLVLAQGLTAGGATEPCCAETSWERTRQASCERVRREAPQNLPARKTVQAIGEPPR